MLLDKIGIIIVMFAPKSGDIENVKSIAKYYKGVIVDNSSTRNFDADNVGMMKYVWIHPLLLNFPTISFESCLKI